MTRTLHLGDNLATLKTYPDNTFDSIITDPPYLINFLGKKWDSDKSDFTPLFVECLRVLKPGGYILAFGATRMQHRLACMIEDAGFEIRDTVAWIYGSGFPKAQDIGKAIQKRLGVEETRDVYDDGSKSKSLDYGMKKSTVNKQVVVTSDEALEWEGWKTALKPAMETICMARKPYKGSTIDNVLKNGLGALNIDATRVPWADAQDADNHVINIYDNGSNLSLNMESGKSAKGTYKKSINREQDYIVDKLAGRLESVNTGIREDETPIITGTDPIHGNWEEYDEDNPTIFREESYDEWVSRKFPKPQQSKFCDHQGYVPANEDAPLSEVHNGGRYPSNVIGEVAEGYQKYYYSPKVSRKERHIGFDIGDQRICSEDDQTRGTQADHSTKPQIGNNHPTVKPVALMEYLIKLVTPPSTPTLQRKVLDPFMGSGSTGMAATKLGHHFTGCELDPKYVAIAETRIEAWNTPEEPDTEFSNLFDA